MTRGSVRAEQRSLVADMRGRGASWSEISRAIRERYGVNARVAMRAAHGWSQDDVAKRWTVRWPDDPKTYKNVSTWEIWPGRGGHMPSPETLDRLAMIYECGVADLLDSEGYGHLDTERQLAARLAREFPAVLATSPEAADDAPASERLAQLVDWLDALTLPELADRVREATAHAGDPVTRRAAMAKLAAALSLVVAEPLAAGPAAASDAPPATPGEPVGGVWRSRYTYYSDGRAREFEGEHLVQLRRNGDRLSGRSLPTVSGSVLDLDLTVAGSIVTGTWTERTSPTGYYRGATYHGTLQVIANPTGRLLAGAWLGYGKTGKVNTGAWTLEWIDRPSEVARYRAKG